MTKSKQSHLDLPISALAYRPDEPGLLEKLDLTKQWSGALVVRSGLPALQVADLADLNKMKLIVTVDADDRVEGVVAPGNVVDRAAAHLSDDAVPGSFSGTLTELLKRPPKGGFDWLTSRGPDLYWCKEGKHLTTERPCSQHPG